MPLEILLVDDDPDDVALTRLVLGRGPTPVRIGTARHGEEALDKLRAGAERPDLILLDLSMPIMDGREFLRVAKKDPALKTIPVVVLTTSRVAEEIVKCYGLGANGFVSKPMGLDGYGELEAIVSEYWLERCRRARS